MSFNASLLNKLPMDIIINEIMPFTYTIQNKDLMQDVRSFYTDMNLLENMFYDYNDIVISNDLILFCNNFISPLCDLDDRYEKILRRLYVFKDKKKDELRHFAFYYFHKSILVNPGNKIRFLFGLLTPLERTRFFNHFYIDYD
jgi:hypothetical protein